MTGRIITARHGRPDLSRDVSITAREYGDWWARYDESGLHPDEKPPETLIELAKDAPTVLSSTLPRAIETAAKATGGRESPADPMFVEAPLPPPPLPSFLRLRPGQWGVISRVLWILGYAPDGVEHHRETWERVGKIVSRLETHAADGDVVLCAHGYLNWMIDRRLKREGWTRAGREGGNHYWSWRIYERPRAKSTVGAQALAE
ncbi:MAG: histidine phosphatase family protein [Pseudomonadota bacterium]